MILRMDDYSDENDNFTDQFNEASEEAQFLSGGAGKQEELLRDKDYKETNKTVNRVKQFTFIRNEKK